MLLRLHQFQIHRLAHPGVGRRILDLRVAQLRRFPVGQLLRLADAHAQNDGGHLLDALVPNAPLPDDLLQIHKSRRLKLAEPLQAPDVIPYGRSHFEDVGVCQNLAQPMLQFQAFEAEKESAVSAGELQERHFRTRLQRREARPRLRIKSQQLPPRQIVHRLLERRSLLLNHRHLPRERSVLQLHDVVYIDTLRKHNRQRYEYTETKAKLVAPPANGIQDFTKVSLTLQCPAEPFEIFPASLRWYGMLLLPSVYCNPL